MLEKKNGTMTSMRHLPRGHLGDPVRQQKNSYLEFNQVGVLESKSVFRKRLKLGFKLFHFLIYQSVHHKRDSSSFPSKGYFGYFVVFSRNVVL